MAAAAVAVAVVAAALVVVAVVVAVVVVVVVVVADVAGGATPSHILISTTRGLCGTARIALTNRANAAPTYIQATAGTSGMASSNAKSVTGRMCQRLDRATLERPLEGCVLVFGFRWNGCVQSWGWWCVRWGTSA